MARAAAGEPDVGDRGMSVEEEVGIRRIFILADARLDDRLRRECGEASPDELPEVVDGFGRYDPIERSRVDWRARHIVADFESAALVARHAVPSPLAEVDPSGARRPVEPGVTSRRAEIDDVLAGCDDAVADDSGKHAAQPWPAREDEGVGLDGAAVVQHHVRQATGPNRPRTGMSRPVGAALSLEAAPYQLARSTSEENARLGLEVRDTHVVEV